MEKKWPKCKRFFFPLQYIGDRRHAVKASLRGLTVFARELAEATIAALAADGATGVTGTK